MLGALSLLFMCRLLLLLMMLAWRSSWRDLTRLTYINHSLTCQNRPNPELETFTLTCDFVIREVVREDGTSVQVKGDSGIETMDGLLASMKRLHEQEIERSQKARVMSVDELVELNQEDLLKLQVRDGLKSEVWRYTIQRMMIDWCNMCLYVSARTLKQENTHAALTRKVEIEQKCSICLERMKDHVCVPCGHR